ncbi:MAG: hypothetical protein ACTS1Z_00005 [Parasphingopyxis sp.]|uniref:hypothetical protein n=1 Tax=Parasphingopyxis sp. TaxID=1920299 RepID=UPI003FA15DE8
MPARLLGSFPHIEKSWLRLIARLASLAALALAVHALVPADVKGLVLIADMAVETPWSLAMMLGLYAVLLAVPFVPGAEIGIALMVVFGAVMALPVYIATVVALSIAFLFGRVASRCGLTHTQGAVAPARDPLADLMTKLHTRGWLRPPMRIRWLAVIVLINTPGNTVVGGGGGIAMAVGYSRTFTYPAFLACVAVAVAPVPATVLLAEHFGFVIDLEQWVQGSAEISPGAVARD